MTKVEAVRAFSGQSGSREKGEQFEYDMSADPLKLKELGLVRSAPKDNSAKAD